MPQLLDLRDQLRKLAIGWVISVITVQLLGD